MILQVYYMAEIYRELKRRAVTHEEWQTVASYFMYPLCAFIIDIFGMVYTAADLTEPDNQSLLTFLLVLKNLTAGSLK